jgi:hypothetical protein
MAIADPCGRHASAAGSPSRWWARSMPPSRSVLLASAKSRKVRRPLLRRSSRVAFETGPRTCRTLRPSCLLYRYRAAQPARLSGTRDALPTLVLLDDRRLSKGGWLMKFLQRTWTEDCDAWEHPPSPSATTCASSTSLHEHEPKERGVYTPRGGAPSPQRRTSREAPSGQNAARTGFRVMSSKPAAREEATRPGEWNEGLRQSPLHWEPFAAGCGQTPCSPVMVSRELPVLSLPAKRRVHRRPMGLSRPRSCSNPLC